MVNINERTEKMIVLVIAVTFAGLPAATYARSLHTRKHKPMERSLFDTKVGKNDWTVPEEQRHSLTFMRYPPTVYLSLGNRQQHYRTSQPLQPDMTVLDLLIAAVKSNMDTVNPYNVQLQWDETLECYTIVKALGVENSSSHTWQLKIRHWTNQVVYKGQCMPRHDVTLSAFNTVSISYRSSRKQTSVREIH